MVRCARRLTSVAFYPGSRGHATAIVYNLNDLSKLGKYDLELQHLGKTARTYVCSQTAVKHGLCSEKDLGLFIVDDTYGPVTSIKQAKFDFGSGINKTEAMSYNVTETGYYCIGATSLSLLADPRQTDLSEGQFEGHAAFHNVFAGNLPAGEHPKLGFYGLLTLLYIALGAVWLALCIRHRDQIVTVQHFITGTIVFLIVEMACQWGFYKYFNTHAIDYLRFRAADGSASVTSTARFLLVLVNLLDAMRNSLSLFLLLIVSMGYGVVRPTIGSVVTKVYILTALHFVFGMIYSVGVIFILLDINATWVFFFVIPLSMTLTTFMVWTLYSLKSTILYLDSRHQKFKGAMFQRLYFILLGAVAAVMGFFCLTTFLIVMGSSDDPSTEMWKYRWIILDGSLCSVYFVVFALIAYVWRPTGHNMRLAMSDELATDEEAAGNTYEVHTLGGDDDDELDDDAAEIHAEHLHHLSRLEQEQDYGGIRLPDKLGKQPDWEEEEEDGPPPYSTKGASSVHKMADTEDLVFDADVDGQSTHPRTSYDADADDTERERLRLSEDDAQRKDA
ncbi:hypothetical protein MVES1_000371 [Malassezia vespertilionis]|uniref:uncharacterized protein n=1 Tax=Malassezia vespertilionis TaxID=2020962 RepID=UPI0024B0B692|nr:uncharacterized protein MVES1_000371 [Malassezia vespertilionis]WFD05046.1 hypothetical protein MVES1_000371 [Malassezia vespertilionis]